MIVAKNVHYSYVSDVKVLDGIDLEIMPGTFLAILGVNGCGKSTLMSCLAGIMRPDTGTIELDGEDLFSIPRSVRATKLTFVPQHFHANAMTVYDTVLLGRRPLMDGSPTQQDFDSVEKILSDMGLEHLALRYVDELSGGEFQKTILARALAQNANTLLFDEPTNNLDLANQHDVLAIISKLAHESNLAIAAVLHDINLALRYCDKFLLLKGGKPYAYGSDDVVDERSIMAVYDIPSDIIEHNGNRLVIPR